MLGEQITVTGSIMGTLQDVKRMISLVIKAGIKPEIGQVLPVERAKEALQVMWEGETQEQHGSSSVVSLARQRSRVAERDREIRHPL